MTPLLALDDIEMIFETPGSGWLSPPRRLVAVGGVSLSIEPGRALGLVGESGCGKSTLARIATQFQSPSRGTIRVDGVDLAKARPDERRRLRRSMQMVFQNPAQALDPRMTIGAQIEEALAVNAVGSSGSERDRLLSLAGLAAHLSDRYPHQISGGQKQRVVIARALAAKPRLLICDEPLSALDVSVQAQIVALLRSLRQELGLSYLFISHQLSSVRHICDDVAVMYAGVIVEYGPVAQVFDTPRHPYTRVLLSAALDPRRPRSSEVALGEPPNPFSLPPGCAFHPRCRHAIDACHTNKPRLRPVLGERQLACPIE